MEQDIGQYRKWVNFPTLKDNRGRVSKEKKANLE